MNNVIWIIGQHYQTPSTTLFLSKRNISALPENDLMFGVRYKQSTILVHISQGLIAIGEMLTVKIYNFKNQGYITGRILQICQLWTYQSAHPQWGVHVQARSQPAKETKTGTIQTSSEKMFLSFPVKYLYANYIRGKLQGTNQGSPSPEISHTLNPEKSPMCGKKHMRSASYIICPK